MKGKLKEWLKANGKESAGALLDTIGENTNIPFISKMMEAVGESMMKDPNLSDSQKKEVAEILALELDYYKNEQDNVTKRWESDNQQDLKFPRLIRPSVIAYSWLLLTFLAVADYYEIVIESADRIISLIELVNLAYFGSRGYEKVIKYKNKRK